MRLINLFGLIAVGAFVVACDDDPVETETQDDTQDDTGDDTGDDTMETSAAAGYAGAATVGMVSDTDYTNNTYTGSEWLYVTGTTSGTDYCKFTWAAAGTPLNPAVIPFSTCTNCAWGFDVAMTGGTLTAGDCGAYLSSGSNPDPNGGNFSYGFSASFYDSYYEATYTDVATYYYSGTGGSGWYSVPLSSFDSTSGAYTYDFALGYVTP